MQESPLVRVCMESVPGRYSSVKLTRAEFAKNLKPLPASPEPWAARQRPLTPKAIKSRQSTLGELCWAAAVSWTDICARLARIAHQTGELQGGDVYRISGLVKTVKVWQEARNLKCASTSGAMAPPRGNIGGRMQFRGEKIHCGPGPSRVGGMQPLATSRREVSVDWVSR